MGSPEGDEVASSRMTKIRKADEHAQRAESVLGQLGTWTQSDALRAQTHAALAAYWLERSRERV